MKNGVECYKDFFPYFKALKTNCEDIVDFVSCLYARNEGLGFLKLADIVLIIINPSPCYVNIFIEVIKKLLL